MYGGQAKKVSFKIVGANFELFFSNNVAITLHLKIEGQIMVPWHLVERRFAELYLWLLRMSFCWLFLCLVLFCWMSRYPTWCNEVSLCFPISQSVCLPAVSFCLCLTLLLCLSICPVLISICLFLGWSDLPSAVSFCLCLTLSFCLSICPILISICLFSVGLFFLHKCLCLFCLSVCLSFYLPSYSSVRLSVCLPACMCITPFKLAWRH